MEKLIHKMFIGETKVFLRSFQEIWLKIEYPGLMNALHSNWKSTETPQVVILSIKSSTGSRQVCPHPNP